MDAQSFGSEPSLVYNGLAENPAAGIVLADGTQLSPGTRRFLMYLVVSGHDDASELQSLADLARFFDLLQQSMSLQPIAFGSAVTKTQLSHEWSLHFDRVDTSRALTQQDVEREVLLLGSFDTLEGFTRHWSNLPLARVDGYAAIRLFRKGMSLQADDPVHAGGGQWVTRHSSAEQDRVAIWTALAEAILRGSLPDVNAHGVVFCCNGAKPRPQSTLDCLQVWVDSATQVAEGVGRALAGECVSRVQAQCHIEFGFVPHQRAAARKWGDPISGGCSSSVANAADPTRLTPSPVQATGSGTTTPRMRQTVYRHDPYMCSLTTAPHYPSRMAGLGVSAQGYSSGGSYSAGWDRRSSVCGLDPTDLDDTDVQSNVSGYSDVGWRMRGGGVPMQHLVDGPAVHAVLQEATASLLGYSDSTTPAQRLQSAPTAPPVGGRPAPLLPHGYTPAAAAVPKRTPTEDTTPHSPGSTICALGDGEVSRKKKRNKPDKHQRERLRRKKAKQQMLEEVMSQMAGVKCSECELHLATARCKECPDGRQVFCRECFEGIHKVGKRKQHSDYLVFETPGEEDHLEGGGVVMSGLRGIGPGDDGDTEPETPCRPIRPESSSPATPIQGVCGTRDITEALGEHAQDFHDYVRAEIGSFSSLKHFKYQRVEEVVDGYCKERSVPAPRRGRISQAVVRWAAAAALSTE
eukprot:TRINITY_DN8163_c0_g1_i3.p1 TRINITY_DN8163_c0_g1~~TRINITY_DN8163_c0_g1_i3.p1  ORF type:complete len:689 (+),score=200.83 TRINITY_DN8163_c0_g1_i3:177-2243(+)